MKLWVVQYREFGEEDQIYLCSSEQIARQRAYNVLWDILEWRLKDTGIDIPSTLEDAERLCFDEEYAYISIYEQEVDNG
tara:strand:- start:3437 stop:3673 length:237 start_codon:yes stop_codon:yes gene_type:complete